MTEQTEEIRDGYVIIAIQNLAIDKVINDLFSKYGYRHVPVNALSQLNVDGFGRIPLIFYKEWNSKIDDYRRSGFYIYKVENGLVFKPFIPYTSLEYINPN